MKAFFSGSLGSKYFTMEPVDRDTFNLAYEVIGRSPNVFVDETHMGTTSKEAYKISRLIGDEAIISPTFLKKVDKIYKGTQNEVTKFLSENIGKSVFTVAW
jgi:hypothetical protein